MITKQMIENGLINIDDLVDNMESKDDYHYSGIDDLLDNLD